METLTIRLGTELCGCVEPCSCAAREQYWNDIEATAILPTYGLRRGDMAELRQDGPYIWVTWLTKLLVGQNSCEWAAWFSAQHEGWSWEKVPSGFDAVGWQITHTARINEFRDSLEALGQTVFTEGQNSFTLRGRTAALGGKPDLIARSGGTGTIFDIKTGRPSPADSVQVMVYMYAAPRALGQYRGITFDGKVVYNDHEVSIPSSAVDETFINNLSDLLQRISTSAPARKVPSPMECGFCNITKSDCPERAAGEERLEGETDDF